ADQVDMIMLGHSPLRRLLMGIINAFGLFIIAVVLLNLGPLRLIGLALIFTLVILTLIGLMSEMAQIGRRVLALRSAQSSIFAQTVTGGMTITLAFLLPFVGQAMLLTILFRSFGTSVYWLFKRGGLPAKQSGS